MELKKQKKKAIVKWIIIKDKITKNKVVKKVVRQAGEKYALMFGIRPEDIYSDNQFIEANPFDSSIEAVIDVVENMGSELYVYFTNVGETQMVARVDAREGFKPRMSVKLGMDLSKCHVFDSETELAVF